MWEWGEEGGEGGRERRGCLGGGGDGFWRGSGLKACGWEREVKGRWGKRKWENQVVVWDRLRKCKESDTLPTS